MENMELEDLVEQGINSLLFSAPVLARDLKRFLEDEEARIRALAKRAFDDKVEQFYWVGSGNSWLNLAPGKYILDQMTNLTSDVLISYEFVWRNPKRLNEKAWVFVSSFSGATEDTVAALRHANDCGATTVSLVNKADSLLGREAKEVIAYNSKALYILPMAAVYLFALELARLYGTPQTEEIVADLHRLPDLFARQYDHEQEPAKKLAQEFINERLIYTLASGPNYWLGYKFGLTVFMENMRVNGSFMDATEFRHGPAEVFDREKPAIVILMGTDSSRTLVDRVRNLCQDNGAHVAVFDSADYGKFHPLLAPFVLMIPLQWFAVWSTLMRGITDLDERVLMGKGILGKGQGVTWP
jgi:fructoselysine-6-P-deglycase FrlB-like protein